MNLRGEVVGINTFIETRTGGNLGIGFAVPSDVIVGVYNQIVEHGKVRRGYLGISMNTLPMTDAMKAHFKLKGKGGVLVTDLSGDDSPARAAGIQPEDVIIAVNGKPVGDPDALRGVVANLAPGTKVPVTLVRDGRELTKELTLKERPGQLAARSGRPMDIDEADAAPKPRDRPHRRGYPAPPGRTARPQGGRRRHPGDRGQAGLARRRRRAHQERHRHDAGRRQGGDGPRVRGAGAEPQGGRSRW